MKPSYVHKCSNVRIAILDVCACVIPDTEAGALIPRINTPAAYRGKGIASRLLSKCIKDADAEELILYLDVSPSDGLNYTQLMAWYKRYGFVDHKKHKGLLMRKPRLIGEG